MCRYFGSSSTGYSNAADDTLCQKEANYTLTFSPPNGYWTTPPTLPLQSSSCANAIATFPFSDPFETGLTNWTNDPLNDPIGL